MVSEFLVGEIVIRSNHFEQKQMRNTFRTIQSVSFLITDTKAGVLNTSAGDFVSINRVPNEKRSRMRIQINTILRTFICNLTDVSFFSNAGAMQNTATNAIQQTKASMRYMGSNKWSSNDSKSISPNVAAMHIYMG
jgi:hypothetical protein